MREMMRYIQALCAVLMLAFTGCDVHEFPEEESSELVPFTLKLDFTTDMPLYDTYYYDANGSVTREDGKVDTKAAIDMHDIRYTIRAYRTDNTDGTNVVADTTYIFTKSNWETYDDLNYTAKFGIKEGTYTFRAWVDFVDAGSTADKYYITDEDHNRDETTGSWRTTIKKVKNVNDIKVLVNDLNGDGEEDWITPDSLLVGSSDFRDAFQGTTVDASVKNPIFYAGEAVGNIKNEAQMTLQRPMGKYKFIATDVDAFISRVVKKMQLNGKLSTSLNDKEAFDKVLQSIDLNNYRIIFRYGAYMPCCFNMFTSKPGDSWHGSSWLSDSRTNDEDGVPYATGHLIYESKMSLETNIETGEREMVLGFDYLFANGSEGYVDTVTVEVYDLEDGEMMSRSKQIGIYYMRSQLTIIKGEFLTSKAAGGVSIEPGYDGDWNIPVLPL